MLCSSLNELCWWLANKGGPVMRLVGVPHIDLSDYLLLLLRPTPFHYPTTLSQPDDLNKKIPLLLLFFRAASSIAAVKLLQTTTLHQIEPSPVTAAGSLAQNCAFVLHRRLAARNQTTTQLPSPPQYPRDLSVPAGQPASAVVL